MGTLAQTVSDDQDNSLLGNLSRWLGRPGYALRSLLGGDLEGAGSNLLQMGMDLPTGGFLNRDLSIANLFSETGDITSKRERPEFSDLIDYRGKGMGRFGVDVLGGIATDPLTYLTFGGSGIAKASLTGLARAPAAAKVGSALRQTSAGAAKLASASDDVIRGLSGPLGDAFSSGALKSLDDLAVASDDVLGGIFKNIGDTGARRAAAAKAARRLEANAIDTLMPQGVRLGKSASEEALDSGVRALLGEGYLLDNTALRLDVPFTSVNQTIPGGENIWGKIGGLTAPGFGLKALRVANAPMADMVEASGRAAWAWTKETFHDGIAKAGAHAGLQHVVRGAKFKHAGDLKRGAIAAREIFEGIDDEGLDSLGKLMAKSEDRFLDDTIGRIDDLASSFAEEAGKNASSAKRRAMIHAGGHSDEAINSGGKAAYDEMIARMTGSEAAMASTRSRALASRKAAFQEEVLTEAAEGWKTYTPATNELGGWAPDAVGEVPGLGDLGRSALKGYFGKMEEVTDELVKLGVWKNADMANPFYVPHQVQPILAELMGDPLARKNQQLMAGVKSVFDGKRKISTAREFAKHVTAQVDMAAEGVPEILKELVDLGGDAMDYNLRDLTFKRLAAHANTTKRATIWEEGKRMGMLAKEGESAGDASIKAYVEGQLKGAGAPDSTVYKMLAGGKIKTPVDPAQAARLRKAGRTLVEENGKTFVVNEVKGINHYVKPLLTSFPTNPAFHVRNWLGAALMTTLDPDLGFKSVGQAADELFGSFPAMAWSKGLGDQGKSRKLTAMVIEAANGSDEAMQALSKSNAMVGKYTIQEAIEAVQNGVGKVSQADLSGNLKDELAELMGKAASTEGRGTLGRNYDSLVRFGEKAANHTEEGMRTAGILRLMEKGVDPTEAIRRTNRAFVDYSSQSVAESWARQVFPFAKFAIGSSAWLGEFARRPRLLGGITHARNSADAQLGPDEVLPERVADSFAIPMGKDKEGNQRYITSLGLPHEAALNMLSAGTSFKGFRKNVLGAMHPIGKFPLEAATNRDFFFGDKFGSSTKAPNFLPKSLTKETTGKNGKKRYEVPGFYRELFDAAPTSRMLKTLDRFLDDKRTLFDATLQGLSGVRVQTVDQKRELRGAIEAYLKAKVESGQVIEFSNWVAKGDPADVPEDLKIVLAGLRAQRKKKKRRRP